MFTCVWAQYREPTRARVTVYQPLRRTVASRPTLIRIYGHDDRGGASAPGAILLPVLACIGPPYPLPSQRKTARLKQTRTLSNFRPSISDWSRAVWPLCAHRSGGFCKLRCSLDSLRGAVADQFFQHFRRKSPVLSPRAF
ncbi:Piso0_005466 [Millerozyma farinosa CBS 7064]|uniref:Piso0_005466 protein n=1 Tax=Pichia sorbitophila (strain ATCC MYA-4447 / BCRC 22081 / CBS 7064 / NBRC 10061 / NRRL Y-12695) TaxID=559304 RepID=G8XZ34_PICSO|nr:Piso0_005466 [Millerozyma farinosa CBS 7064]